MIENFSHRARALFITLCVALLCSAVLAQPQKAATGKSAVSTSCDGALDIVPSKPMTFARKRRPTNAGKPAPADSKTDKKPSGEEKKGI